MKKYTLFAVVFLLTVAMSAQEVVSTQGDSYSTTSNTIDYTIGESVISTVSNGNNDLTQGFHQTRLAIVGVEDLADFYAVDIYPNPTSEVITLNIEQYKGLTVHLFDVVGKQLQERQLTKEKTIINVHNYPKGTYLLTLTQTENKKIKTYKIIKN